MLLAIYSCDSSSDAVEEPIVKEFYEGDVALDGFVDDEDINLAFGKVTAPIRVSVQSEFASPESVLLDEWVAIGLEYDFSIMLDYTKPFNGKPSFYVEMTDDPTTDNDETSGRCEVSYCFATAEDFYASGVTDSYEDCQVMKTVYHYGRGIIPRDCVTYHQFSVNIPSELDPEVKTIFAQWHGMPDRTLVRDPDGYEQVLTSAEFMKLCETMTFDSGTGYDLETGEENGWRVVANGSYPPLTFGVVDGYFYIKAHSDKKWMSDVDERCNVNPSTDEVMVPEITEHKQAIIACRIGYDIFPKDCWITFNVAITWSQYSGSTCVITRDGALDVTMEYGEGDDYQQLHLVNNERLQIGRNDENGYYFKYGIYRPAGTQDDEKLISTFYNVAGYSQWF